MLRIILSLHSFFYGVNDKRVCQKKKNILLWAVCNVMARACNWMLVCNMSLKKALGLYPVSLNGEGNVVVSLTSFPKRIGDVWMVVDSMMRQSVRPATIQLYLTKEEFPEGEKSLPHRLLEYRKRGLDIRFRDENLMPHNKYFYALQENTNKLVITIDDDIYYHTKMIENLLEIYQAHPDCVCANSVKVVNFSADNIALPYSKWDSAITRMNPSIKNVALGFNGVLYPTALFVGKDEMFDARAIRECALRADDLWLRALETVYDIHVANGDYLCPGIIIEGSQTISLMSINTGSQSQNDVQWQRLNDRYDVNSIMLGVEV